MNAGAAKTNHGDETVCAVEAEGPARDGADLPVEALDSGVRETRVDVGEDAVEVLLDRARYPDKRSSRLRAAQANHSRSFWLAT